MRTQMESGGIRETAKQGIISFDRDKLPVRIVFSSVTAAFALIVGRKSGVV